MLKVGINWLTPYTLPIVQRLIEEGIADFCEVMVDNAIHLPASKIREALPDVPIALHIVSSGFLTKSSKELQDVAQYLRPWIAELNPIYVSDHLPQLNYQSDLANTCKRMHEWQDLLGVKLLLENFPSLNAAGTGQAEFYSHLMRETGCELLFDFSNAYIAELNGAAAFTAWQPLIDQTTHFHAAGFRIDPETGLAIDTHDVPIADEVVTIIQQQFINELKDRTIVMEFDAKLNYELVSEQISKVRTALSGAANDATKDVAATDGDKRRVQGCTFLSASLAAPLKAAPNDSAKNRLIKAVTDWSLRGLDHPAAKGIIMRSKDMPHLAIGLWKGTAPGQPAKIVTLDISAANLPPANACAISYQTGTWAGVEWVEVS